MRTTRSARMRAAAELSDHHSGVDRGRVFRRAFMMMLITLCCAFATAAGHAQTPAPQQAPRTPAAARGGPQTPYQRALEQAYSSLRAVKDGKNADYIPALAKVNPEYFGIVIVTVEGHVYEVGDARVEFAIESAAKPFVLARTLAAVGPEAVEKRIGVNQTGQPFNSLLAIALLRTAKQKPPSGNPLVNAGAIATVDMLPVQGKDAKWTAIADTLNGFAGRLLSVNEEVYRSETETNQSNNGIAMLLKSYEVIQGDPLEALDLYTKECSVDVTARDLATMGATLANGGRNPLTGQQVISEDVATHVLSVMATTGLYETSGEWLYHVGVPAKSGVGGGIVAVVPGRFAIGTFSPPLDEPGNSVRGQQAIAKIMTELGGNVFASKPKGKAAKGAKP
jgi:glutaminase